MGSSLRVVWTRVHGSRRGGILAMAGADLLVIHCLVSSSSLAGVDVRGRSTGAVLRSRIEGGRSSGLYVHDAGRVVAAGNSIWGESFKGQS